MVFSIKLMTKSLNILTQSGRHFQDTSTLIYIFCRQMSLFMPFLVKQGIFALKWAGLICKSNIEKYVLILLHLMLDNI